MLAIDISFHVSGSVIRTTKRPVPLEHCLFYSGELHRICEGENFIPQGLKTAKYAFKKNNSTVGGGPGAYTGPSVTRDGVRGQKRDNQSHSKQNKHGSQNLGAFSGTSWGNQNNGGGQNNWRSWRLEASLWLQLVSKLLKNSLLPVCQIMSSLSLSHHVGLFYEIDTRNFLQNLSP